MAQTLGELAAQPAVPHIFASAPEAVMHMLRD
jgi:hypothetical protein